MTYIECSDSIERHRSGFIFSSYFVTCSFLGFGWCTMNTFVALIESIDIRIGLQLWQTSWNGLIVVITTIRWYCKFLKFCSLCRVCLSFGILCLRFGSSVFLLLNYFLIDRYLFRVTTTTMHELINFKCTFFRIFFF